jgi:HTH-type transcriptional regulator / antitoxin HigA
MTPIEMLKEFMKTNNLKPKDLKNSIGNKDVVSRILNCERPLTLRMIRNLYNEFNLPLEVLIQEYPINDKMPY